MKPMIIKAANLEETATYERCSVAENYHSDNVSVARATVKAGVTTVAHHLTGVEEIYIITNGQGVCGRSGESSANKSSGG